MSKTKEYLSHHIEKCYYESKKKHYYISYKDCENMVYHNAEIDITKMLVDKSNPVIIKYDKETEKIIYL